MAKSEADMLDSMKKGLEARTGKPFDYWVRRVQESGIEKHGDQVRMLKGEGLGHGHANMVCQAAKGRFEADEGDMLSGQYEGKEGLRPVYDALEAFAKTLGGVSNCSHPPAASERKKSPMSLSTGTPAS